MEDATDVINCTHSDDCGACALLGVGYEHQLQRKDQVVAQALAKHPSLRQVSALPCVPSPLRDGYRNRAKMAVALSRRGPRLGYFQTGTREIVDAPDCRVLIPELLETTRQIRQFLETSRQIPSSSLTAAAA